MDTDIRIRAVGPPHLDLVMEMYDRFEPLGAALGLPPRRAEARREWIEAALGRKLNVAAFSEAGEVVGHCFLVADTSGSAELAVFVHQEFRRRGVGMALVEMALGWGRMEGLERVWSVTSSDNEPALRLQMRCGFRRTCSAFGETEMEVALAVAEAARPASVFREEPAA